MTLGLGVLYRYGPDRDDARWQWVSPGAIVAALMWVLGSMIFSVYTANFARYNETYGSLGAVVVLLLWLFLTASVVIIGAEINCELDVRPRGTAPWVLPDRWVPETRPPPTPSGRRPPRSSRRSAGSATPSEQTRELTTRCEMHPNGGRWLLSRSLRRGEEGRHTIVREAQFPEASRR